MTLPQNNLDDSYHESHTLAVVEMEPPNLEEETPNDVGRGKRIIKPRIRYTPTSEELQSNINQNQATQMQSRQVDQCHATAEEIAKQRALDERRKEAKAFNKKVKEGKKNVSLQMDILCLESALNYQYKTADIKVKERVFKRVVTRPMATQTIQFENVIPSSHDQVEVENSLRAEIDDLKRQSAAKDAEIRVLNTLLGNVLPNAANPQNNFNLDDIRNVVREEMAPDRQQQLPDENVLRQHLGNRRSRVMHAGVEITNGDLQKAKNSRTYSTRINHLVSGYWLEEQIPFVAATRPPHNVDQRDFIKINDNDVLNIQRILNSLQEGVDRIPDITPEDLQFTAIKRRIINSLSYLRRE
ncbi:uncharacterized protein LOC127289550 isoform X2 [Leptopilina boulardi]|uniref:uncharacterized protein LOC127289550 isoform X2 n=1 Tax=Leptopilina boulardi TaxID=63433 RepID=UPI0021F55E33|nr:uncharacterized protein LOC127289550 isoform X2 [Leptopilina boulardi]